MQRLLLRRPSVGVSRHDAGRGALLAMVQRATWASATRAASSSPSSSSSSPPPPSSSPSTKGKRTREVKTTNTTNGAVTVTFGQMDTVNAYNEFSKLVSCCDVDGLLKGSEQAYASTAVLVDALVKPTADMTDQLHDESKEKLRKNILDPSARMTFSRWAIPRIWTQAKAILSENFDVALSDDTKEGAELAKQNKKQQEPAAVQTTQEVDEASRATVSAPLLDPMRAAQHSLSSERAVVSAFQRILPMSAAMANKLFNMWDDHRKGKDDVLRLAASADLVVESQLVAFIRFDDAMLHFNPVLDCVRSMDVTLSDSVLHYWQTHSLTDVVKPVATTPTDVTHAAPSSSSTSSSIPAAETPKTAATGMTRLSARPATTVAEKEAQMYAEDGTEFTAKIRVDETMMNDIPLGAKALVLVALDVVCPPRRFARYYDYFYSRVVGCENDYQRMAVSRLFALHTPHVFVRMLECMVKPFTTRFEIGFTPYVGRKLRLPEDMSQTIPTERKLVCFYLDTSNRWVLSDIFHTGAVMSKLPPMSEV